LERGLLTRHLILDQPPEVRITGNCDDTLVDAVFCTVKPILGTRNC